MKKITLKDIAIHFSVSISTVSKALNDSPEISKATSEEIKAYAKEINYTPNFNALSLKNQRTKTIGIIIPNMLNYYFAQVLKGIEKVATQKGYKIITCISNESLQKEIETIQMLSTGVVDGFILSVAEETEAQKEYQHFNSCIEKEIPLVMFDRVVEDINCDKVITNDFMASVNAVNYFKNKGSKKIAFAGANMDLSVGKLRHEGYLAGLKNNNIEEDKDIIITTHEMYYRNHDAVVRPLFDHTFDALIASNESVAIAAMKIAQEKGIKIPEDLSILAFSNGILARHSNPRLTTISQHGEIIGEKAATLLINKLQNNITTTSIETVETDIVIRDSSK
ncbi:MULTISPECIES: LacI family DNA-binding transcriptional regulator [Olleya]|uniref:Transcriptional regulator, LacI family n=1 Tax=Olleya namhaensis TaxID=1144750 RepID=A0A1I3LKJ1_9FLAO|nr:MULTISPECIES: LacI family DNA-binding transcriptional regulator [Olleya]PKG50159.1 LacI family transcriptional regulator [Olleya sp. 1-3]SFI85242.1 transcriptional regulator, LacI family [Olleya namhaensis]